MLGVIEREMVRKFYFMTRPIYNFTRGRAFTKNEAAGTDLSGTWDETILRRNDVSAFQDASKVHTFIENE